MFNAWYSLRFSMDRPTAGRANVDLRDAGVAAIAMAIFW
jgi:hypothetical protein